jgi:hypothetical protein
MSQKGFGRRFMLDYAVAPDQQPSRQEVELLRWLRLLWHPPPDDGLSHNVACPYCLRAHQKTHTRLACHQRANRAADRRAKSLAKGSLVHRMETMP